MEELQKGRKYNVVSGPDYFKLCESLRYSQDNNNYHNHPAHFKVQAREGNKAIRHVSVVVRNMRMVDVTRVEVLGPEMELGGFYKDRVKIIYNPWERGTGADFLEVL